MFLDLCGLSTESVLEIWPSQFKFLTNEFLTKKSVYVKETDISPIYLLLKVYFSLANTEMNLENTVSACYQFVKLGCIVQVETGVSSIGSGRNSSVII